MTQAKVKALKLENKIHRKTIITLHKNLELQRWRAENAERELMEAQILLSK